jgi:hypothetical protein
MRARLMYAIKRNGMMNIAVSTFDFNLPSFTPFHEAKPAVTAGGGIYECRVE